MLKNKLSVKKNLPSISLLILNYNGLHITPLILDSVKKLDYPREKTEVIVIDNASTDGSVEMIRKEYPFVKIIQRSVNIAYPAMDDGVAVCKSKYCFLLNNDVEIHPNCLIEIARRIELQPEVVAISPAIYYYDSRKLQYTIKYVSRSFYNGSDNCNKLTEQQNETALKETYSGLILLSTDFARSMPFVVDPDYFLCGDDIDLAYRIRLMGHTIYRAPNAKLYHKPGSTVLALYANPRLAFFVERNSLQTFLKNLEVHNLLLWFPYFCFVHFTNLFVNVFTLRWKVAKELLRAWYWNAMNVSSIIKKRKQIQRLRKVPDKVIFREMMDERKVFSYLLSHVIFGENKEPE